MQDGWDRRLVLGGGCGGEIERPACSPSESYEVTEDEEP